MFCCAASTGENPCVEVCTVLGLATIPVSVNGTAVAGSGVTVVVIGSEFSAVTFNGITALPGGTTGFSESIVSGSYRYCCVAGCTLRGNGHIGYKGVFCAIRIVSICQTSNYT